MIRFMKLFFFFQFCVKPVGRGMGREMLAVLTPGRNWETSDVKPVQVYNTLSVHGNQPSLHTYIHA